MSSVYEVILDDVIGFKVIGFKVFGYAGLKLN